MITIDQLLAGVEGGVCVKTALRRALAGLKACGQKFNEVNCPVGVDMVRAFEALIYDDLNNYGERQRDPTRDPVPKKEKIETVTEQREAILISLRNRAVEYGITHLAKETGIPRGHFYSMLSREGNPSLDTLLKVLAALDVRMRITIPTIVKP